MKPILLLMSSLVLAGGSAAAQTPVDFKNKQIAMIIGSATGGGTDTIGRLAAPFLTKYLPGHPNIIVRNMPGADGLVALNHFTQQADRDGLTMVTGDGPAIDPLRYRSPQSHYDPGRFEYFGGIGRGGSMLIISSAAEKRLSDKAAAPVTMGIASAIPRAGQLLAAWGMGLLGWNAKWVVGYRATNALMFALQQGELDMTATSNLFSLGDLIESGKFKVLVQSGGIQDGKTVPRPEFRNVPLLSDQLASKLDNPTAAKSFDYWRSVLMVDKFFALPPATPRPIVEAYRQAYVDMIADPDFTERGRKMSEVFEPISIADMNHLVRNVVDTTPEAVEYLNNLLRKQGINGL
jgi:tripartite-type tricarboxylate transporter receptor subunit TctC